MEEYKITPIAYFRSPYKHFLEAPRQATHPVPDCYIEMKDDSKLLLGLQDLEGFDRIWVIFSFHKKADWKPLIHPPRGSNQKRGVFATRSPLRPNHLGMSCLQIQKIEGRKIHVTGGDLLDGTPIFDIKPYLPYCDSFPDSKIGWLEGSDKEKWLLHWSVEATRQKLWLSVHQLHIDTVLENQLEFDPTNSERKRVYPGQRENEWVFAYRTWRIHFNVSPHDKSIEVTTITSGYSEQELNSPEDPYEDKSLHRDYLEVFHSDSK